jgi:hypothetical protein
MEDALDLPGLDARLRGLLESDELIKRVLDLVFREAKALKNAGSALCSLLFMIFPSTDR